MLLSAFIDTENFKFSFSSQVEYENFDNTTLLICLLVFGCSDAPRDILDILTRLLLDILVLLVLLVLLIEFVDNFTYLTFLVLRPVIHFLNCVNMLPNRCFNVGDSDNVIDKPSTS